MTNARIYRFHDAVAAHLGDGSTVYLSPEQARAIGEALVRFADDIERRPYLKSDLATVEEDEIDSEANKRAKRHLERAA